MGASEQQGGAITVSKNGVIVEKTLLDDEFPIPTVKFRIENERDDPVSVTLAETVPEDFSIGTLGFHPDYGSEHWTCLDDERAEYERDVEGQSEIETLYGIRIDDVDRASTFMTEPSIESVTLADPDAVADEQATESEAEAAPEAEQPDENADEKAVTLSLNEESAGETPADEASDTGTADGDIDLSGVAVGEDSSLHVEEVTDSNELDVAVSVPTDPTNAGPETGALIDRLVEELERADVDPEQKATLREELDVGVPSETRARIDSLQDRIETLAAYTGSLEEFLDENGTAQELLEGFETQVEALREDVATIRHHTRANASDIGQLNGNLLDLEDHVETVADRLDSVASQAESIEDDLAGTDDRLDSVAADLADAETTIADNEENIAALDEHLVEVDDDLTDVGDRVATTEADVESLDETTDDHGAAIDELEATTEDIRADVDEEVEAVRDDLETTADDVRADVDEEVEAVRDDLETTAEDVRADVDEEVEAVRDDLETTAEDVRADVDEEVETVTDDVADLEDDVEDLLVWRDELGEMFQ